MGASTPRPIHPVALQPPVAADLVGYMSGLQNSRSRIRTGHRALDGRSLSKRAYSILVGSIQITSTEERLSRPIVTEGDPAALNTGTQSKRASLTGNGVGDRQRSGTAW